MYDEEMAEEMMCKLERRGGGRDNV